MQLLLSNDDQIWAGTLDGCVINSFDGERRYFSLISGAPISGNGPRDGTTCSATTSRLPTSSFWPSTTRGAPHEALPALPERLEARPEEHGLAFLRLEEIHPSFQLRPRTSASLPTI